MKCSGLIIICFVLVVTSARATSLDVLPVAISNCKSEGNEYYEMLMSSIDAAEAEYASKVVGPGCPASERIQEQKRLAFSVPRLEIEQNFLIVEVPYPFNRKKYLIYDQSALDLDVHRNEVPQIHCEDRSGTRNRKCRIELLGFTSRREPISNYGKFWLGIEDVEWRSFRAPVLVPIVHIETKEIIVKGYVDKSVVDVREPEPIDSQCARQFERAAALFDRRVRLAISNFTRDVSKSLHRTASCLSEASEKEERKIIQKYEAARSSLARSVKRISGSTEAPVLSARIIDMDERRARLPLLFQEFRRRVDLVMSRLDELLAEKHPWTKTSKDKTSKDAAKR